MPAKKKPPEKSVSTVEELAVGHFKITGSLESIESVTAFVQSNRKELRRGKMRPVRDDVPMAFCKFALHDFTPDAKLSLPIEIANKLRLGADYEIQCTLLLVEKKGING